MSQISRLTLAIVAVGVLGLVFSAVPSPAAAADSPLVHVVPVRGTIGAGLARFVERSVAEATGAGADQVVVTIDTLGGSIGAALDIRDALISSPVPVTALVENRAWSAGALVALAADELYMTPGSTVGAAEPRPAEEKIISAWRTELEETARMAGRNPQLAAAMVDADVEIPGIVDRGKILTLGATSAVELGFADGVLGSTDELFRARGWENPSVVVAAENQGERLARFVTNPTVAPILLALGFVGVIVEFFVPGFGVPGIIGLASLSAYFGGHMLAGLAGWEAVVAFVVGAILLAVEVFIPGFGIFGLIGVVVVLASIFLAAQSPQQAIRSVTISLLTTIVAIFVLVRYVGPRGLWQRLLLYERLDTERGYVSQRESLHIVGRRGVTLTPLRPAGTVRVDGERLSVVTEGGFIEEGRTVEVVRAEGARVVVREVDEA